MSPKSLAKWRRDRAKVKASAARQDDDAMMYCSLLGCGRTTQARDGKGLSKWHCRYHVQWNNRHGSYWKGTYRAEQLLPYRKAAERYIREHREDRWIVSSLRSLAGLMNRAGPVQSMSDVMVMAPADKAKAALARMRAAGVPAMRLLVVYLGVSAAVAEDPIGPGGEPGEYRRVQVAKAAHRLASGYHTDYGYERYPRSSGLMLRHLGQRLEKACEFMREYHLDAVLELKVAMVGARPPSPSPPIPRSRNDKRGGASRGW
jgi:hypothetical protein